MIFRTIATAFQFLTIIPLRTDRKVSEKEVLNSVCFFPFIGAVQGFLLALSAFLSSKIILKQISGPFFWFILYPLHLGKPISESNYQNDDYLDCNPDDCCPITGLRRLLLLHSLPLSLLLDCHLTLLVLSDQFSI